MDSAEILRGILILLVKAFIVRLLLIETFYYSGVKLYVTRPVQLYLPLRFYISNFFIKLLGFFITKDISNDTHLWNRLVVLSRKEIWRKTDTLFVNMGSSTFGSLMSSFLPSALLAFTYQKDLHRSLKFSLISIPAFNVLYLAFHDILFFCLHYAFHRSPSIYRYTHALHHDVVELMNGLLLNFFVHL